MGVVGHIRFSRLAGEESSSGSSQSAAKGAYYFSLYQQPAPYGRLIAKTSGNPAALAGYIREAVRNVDANQPVHDLKAMDSLIADSLGPQRFATTLLAAFAGLAILLAAIGLYGLMSYSVSQRTNEIGIRMALGAQQGEVVRMVLGQGTKLALAGVAAGVIVGLVLTRLMQSLLYGVSAADPLCLSGRRFFLYWWLCSHATFPRGGRCASIRWWRCGMSEAATVVSQQLRSVEEPLALREEK